MRINKGRGHGGWKAVQPRSNRPSHLELTQAQVNSPRHFHLWYERKRNIQAAVTFRWSFPLHAQMTTHVKLPSTANYQGYMRAQLNVHLTPKQQAMVQLSAEKLDAYTARTNPGVPGAAPSAARGCGSRSWVNNSVATQCIPFIALKSCAVRAPTSIAFPPVPALFHGTSSFYSRCAKVAAASLTDSISLRPRCMDFIFPGLWGAKTHLWWSG